MRKIRTVSIALLDTDADRRVDKATVSYTLFDDLDPSYSARGSFELSMDLSSLDSFMSDVIDQICLTEELSSCPSSSSSSP